MLRKRRGQKLYVRGFQMSDLVEKYFIVIIINMFKELEGIMFKRVKNGIMIMFY